MVSVKGTEFETREVVAFYYNNKILVKRVIANAGEWVDIDKDGNIYVNNKMLEEPYIVEKAYGETNIELPYQVPDSRIFVVGDNRDASIDSRNTSVGCVSDEQIVGKIVFRIWPSNQAGPVKEERTNGRIQKGPGRRRSGKETRQQEKKTVPLDRPGHCSGVSHRPVHHGVPHGQRLHQPHPGGKGPQRL